MRKMHRKIFLFSILVLLSGFSLKRLGAQQETQEESHLNLHKLIITAKQLSPLPQEPMIDPLLGLHDNGVSTPVYELIRQSTKSLDIEIYEMKDPQFRELLLDAAKNRGVKIRIIKDPATIADTCLEHERVSPTDKPVCSEEKKFVAELKKAGGIYSYFKKETLCGIPGKICYMHGKLILADFGTTKARALVSSGNFSTMSLCGALATMKTKPGACNRDYTYITTHKPTITKLQSIFNTDLLAKTYDVKKHVLGRDNLISMTVSPTAMQTLLLLIKMAKKQILISTQYLNDPEINQELMNAASIRGVEVKTLASDLCYYGPNSMSPTAKQKEFDKYEAMYKAKVKNLFFTKEIKVAGKTGYNHSKALVIDAKIGWIGSINYSEDSLLRNREFGLIFSSKKDLFTLINSIESDMKSTGAIDWKREKVRCAI